MPSAGPDALACSRTRGLGRESRTAGTAPALAHVREGNTLVIWKLIGSGVRCPILSRPSTIGKGEVWACAHSRSRSTPRPRGAGSSFTCSERLGSSSATSFAARTRAGLTAAAARGRKGGRKPVVTAEVLRKARVLTAQGLNVREAAARLKVGKTALYEALAASST